MTNTPNKAHKLYRNPSFLKGAARVFDLYGNLDRYMTHSTEQEADENALKNDWEAVGQDLLTSIQKYGKKIQNLAT